MRLEKAKVCLEKTKVRLEKRQGHWRVRSLAFPGETNAFAFALHLQVFAWAVIFFFLQKNLRVQNRVRNRVQIRGPKGGSTFCQHPCLGTPPTHNTVGTTILYCHGAR